MSNHRVRPLSVPLVEELWTATATAEARNTSQQVSLDHALTELSAMTGHQRLRLSRATSRIQAILWTVLITGAIVTILSACLFGSVDLRMHLIQMMMLTLLIAVTLLAIADMSRPFQSYVRVSPAGFERARATLQNLSRESN